MGLLLIKVSKASFIALMNPSLRVKQLCATLSILSLKSSRSCTMSLSFSGVHTISPPKVWGQGTYHQGECAFRTQACFLSDYFFLYCVWTMCIPLCNPSRTAAVWEVLLSPCWRAGRGGSAQSHGSHPAGCSDLAQKIVLLFCVLKLHFKIYCLELCLALVIDSTGSCRFPSGGIHFKS